MVIKKIYQCIINLNFGENDEGVNELLSVFVVEDLVIAQLLWRQYNYLGYKCY